MVQAGVFPIETIQVDGNLVSAVPQGQGGSSLASCPPSHPFLIGGSYTVSTNSDSWIIGPTFDTNSNSYEVIGNHFGPGGSIAFTAHALCANFNFPMQMGMIGGELLDINTISLLVGAIGVNPIITALVGITIAGVAGQAVWFVHRRKKK